MIAKVSTVLASALLVTGCSFSLPSEADTEPCKKISEVLSNKVASLPTGGFDAAKLANSIETEVISIAPENLQNLLRRINTAITSDPIAAGDLTAAATEIAMRCALVGVNVEFPNPQDLLLN